MPGGMLAFSHVRKPIATALVVWEALKPEFVVVCPSFFTYCGLCCQAAGLCSAFPRVCQTQPFRQGATSFLFIYLKPNPWAVGFLYRFSTSEAFILTVAYSCWEILQEKWTILAFQTGFEYHCSGTWTQWCMHLPGRRQQLPDRFTISNLKLHYLFRQDFLASNRASFFASSVDKTKDSGMLDGPQSMPCDPWWWPGSAKLDGEVSRCKQVPADHLRLGNWNFGPCCTLPSWLLFLKVPFRQYWSAPQHAALWWGWCCSTPALQLQLVSCSWLSSPTWSSPTVKSVPFV